MFVSFRKVLCEIIQSDSHVDSICDPVPQYDLIMSAVTLLLDYFLNFHVVYVLTERLLEQHCSLQQQVI